MSYLESLYQFLENRKALNRIFFAFLFLANLSYGTYILLLGWFNRFAADDYCYLNEFNKYGFASPKAWYVQWQGRFTAQTLINVVFKLYDFFHSLLPYTILLYALYIYALQKILQIGLKKYGLQEKYSRFLQLNIAVFIFHIFLASNFAFNTFFWLNVSAMYFGGLASALIGMTELLNDTKKWYSYLIVFVSFLYAGASAEHFSAICLMLLGFALLYHFRKHRFKAFHITVFQKMLLAFAVVFVAFIIMILAPGNNVRRAYFPETSIPASFIISARSLGILLLFYIPSKIKFLFILGFVGLFLGSFSRRNSDFNRDKKLAVYLLLLLPIFIIFLWICFLPNAYAQGNMGPMRAHTHIAFYLVAITFVISFLTGLHIALPEKMLWVFAVLSFFSFFASGLFSLAYDLPEAIKYSKTEDLRLEKLQAAKAENFTGTLLLDSLYQPRKNPMQTEPVLMINEIASSPADSANIWVNKCICGGLQLPYNILLDSNAKK